MTRTMTDPRTAIPSLQPAHLGEVEGAGLITILRDARGDIVERNGTFRVAPDVSPVDLEEAHREGRTVTYRGALHDPDDPTGAEQDVVVDVHLTGIEAYPYDDGEVRTIVNFVEGA